MLKKLRKYRRIFYFLLAVAVVSIAIAMKSRYNNTICADINVTVQDSAVQQFITRNTIINTLTLNIKENIKGNKFKNINMDKIEKIIEQIPFVKKAEVYRTKDNILGINVTQRTVIAHIFDKNGNNFYIDEDGYILPPSKNFTAYVPVFSGNIPHLDSLFGKNVNNKKLKNSVFYDIFILASKIREDQFSNDLIDMVFLKANNDFEFIPKVGDFKIIVGNIDNIETKLKNLKIFYKNVPPKVGWDKYSVINLKYSNQIVCTKK